MTAVERGWSDLGGSGPPLVLTHANGFPTETYRIVLDRLTGSFCVSSYAQRPLWSDDDPATLESWDLMAEDLVTVVSRREAGPVVAVGHSLGGMVVALAAARRPELFAALVLLDPVVFSGLRSFFWGWMKRLGWEDRFFLARGARKRRDHWRNRDAVRRSWTGKRVFAGWDPRVFEDYLRAGVAENADGSIRLRYPKEWEARIFEICPHDEWATLKTVAIPILVVRGETSDTLLPAAARRLEQELPDCRVVELVGTSHFLPMEKPDEVAQLIVDFAGGG